MKATLKISGYSNKIDPKIVSHTAGDRLALKPRIDKISLTFPIDKNDEEGIVGNLIGNSGGSKSDIPMNEILVRRSSRNSGYKHSFDVLLYDLSAHFILEIVPKNKPHAHFVRIELNPQKLGAGWLKHVHHKLITLLTGKYGWTYVIKTADVTQMDVAIDLLGVRMRHLLLDSRKPHPKLKRQLYVGHSGELETLYLFQKSAKHPKVMAYDKRAELIQTVKQPEFGDIPHTRIEMRLRPNIQLSKLSALANPLLAIKVRDLFKDVEPPETHFSWGNFILRCQLKGFEKAVEALEIGSMKAAYMTLSVNADSKIWDAEASWAHWPKVVDRLGISSSVDGATSP